MFRFPLSYCMVFMVFDGCKFVYVCIVLFPLIDHKCSHTISISVLCNQNLNGCR